MNDRTTSSDRRRLFIFGFGYTAKALVRRMAGAGWTIAATTRSADKAETMRAMGAAPVRWTAGEALPADALDGASHMIVSTPPVDGQCPAYAAAADAIGSGQAPVERLIYLSSNGVYGDHDGAWVDESSPLKGASERAKARIAAEEAWASLARSSGISASAFRLPGIYGPGRSAIDQIRAGAARRIVKPGQVFSRAHVDDIAGAIAMGLTIENIPDTVNIADDEPAPPQDVVAFASSLIGVEPPEAIDFETAELSPMARSFYTDNKRVSNNLMKSALGFHPAYPSYREGLRAILGEIAP